MMRDLQYGNIETHTFPMKMTLRLGDGKVDAAKLAAVQTYEGNINRSGVTVFYPLGMKSLAEHVADSFVEAAAAIKTRTGVEWAFDLQIFLVQVSNTSAGFKLTIPLRRNRILKLPLLVSSRPNAEILPVWSAGIAHEVTEASMLASISKRQLVLGDYCVDGIGLINQTRWFRDGVAEYAGSIFNQTFFGSRYQPPAQMYQDLSIVREDLLEWNNCLTKSGPDIYYSASHALIRELINIAGEHAVARIMDSASKASYIDGRILERAVKKAAHLDLKEFLKTYQPKWLGMDVRDTRPDGPSLVHDHNEVIITSVYQGYPADKWRLQPGDVILSVDGIPVISAAWLGHYIAAHQPGGRVLVTLRRGSQVISHRMVVSARDLPRIPNSIPKQKSSGLSVLSHHEQTESICSSACL